MWCFSACLMPEQQNKQTLHTSNIKLDCKHTVACLIYGFGISHRSNKEAQRLTAKSLVTVLLLGKSLNVKQRFCV